MHKALLKPQTNSIYPTDDSLDIPLHRIKSQLPLTDMNELIPLLMIWQNTLIKTMSNTR